MCLMLDLVYGHALEAQMESMIRVFAFLLHSRLEHFLGHASRPFLYAHLRMAILIHLFGHTTDAMGNPPSPHRNIRNLTMES
jgi:hypothetical protein